MTESFKPMQAASQQECIELLRSAQRGVLSDFGDGDYTSITTANIDSADQQSPWYTLDGRRLQAAPTQKGIYIKNGKTIVIK